MNHLEYPMKEIWESRSEWFETLNDELCGEGSYLISEQATAIMADVQCVFCAGAWISVVILALTVIDAHLRDIEVPGYEGNTKRLIDYIGANPALQRLRLRRNALIHLNPDKPAITVDQLWENQAQFEEEARLAIRLMLETIYMSPGV